MAKVLVVDDEELIVKGIRYALERDGDAVTCAYEGNEALEQALHGDFDIILLDVMLPGMDGMEILRRVREVSNVPIIMLTAKGEDMDKILGLEYGADDYVVKPFNIVEVKARMKAILRRVVRMPSEKEDASAKDVVESGDLTLDLESHRLLIHGKERSLTSKEFDMLALLVTNAGKVYSRDMLLKEIWGADYPGDARTVDVHIRRLREKIEPSPSEPRYVHTKWGVGYFYQK